MPSSLSLKDTPLPEIIFGVIGLCAVLASAGYLACDHMAEKSPPDVRIRALRVLEQEGGAYLVEIEAKNAGDRTAQDAVVEGTLRASSGGEALEKSELTFDYLPAGSSRKGGLVFYRNPSRHTLALRARSFLTP